MPERTATAAKAAAEPAARGMLRDTAPPAVVSMILGLQQTNGNQAVGRLLGGALLQPKLRIGAPGDFYEREADRVADQILRGGSEAPIPVSVAHARAPVQRQCHCQDDELVQRECHCQEEKEEERPGFEARVDALRGAGRPLPGTERRFFEPRFGHDFGSVRVHTGAAASEAAEAVRARAFTVGNDVVFGRGEWSPGTDAGKRLLAHELTHVLQQTPLVARRKPLVDRGAEVSEAVPGTEESVTEPESAAPSPETPAQDPGQDEPSPEAVAAEDAPAAAVVVEDDATDVGEGQMKKTEFLTRLRPAVLAAAEAGLSDKSRAAQAGTFVDRWVSGYVSKDADALNRDMSRLVSGKQPATAEEYISAIADSVRSAVGTWQSTGEVPPELSQLAGGLLGGGSLLAGVGSMLFKALPGGPRNAESPQAVRAQLGPGQPIAGGIRSRMETAFGRSFADVRVHADSAASGLASRFNARAFTIRDHIAFGAHEYQPGTLVGDALIAHELAHVIQQRGANESADPVQGDNAGYSTLERDADLSAAAAVASAWGGLRFPSFGSPIPRLTSGLRLQRCGCCGGGPRLTKSTSSPATVAGCGGFNWVVDWALEKPSTVGGWIIQRLDVAADIKKCKGAVVAPGGILDWVPYWEAWEVKPNSKTPVPTSDTFQFGSRGADTKGSVEYRGQPRFCEGYSLPDAFQVNTASPAGGLRMTQTDPGIGAGSGIIPHRIKLQWDCCKTPKALGPPQTE